ncbi:frizzled-8-like protein [Lates japonicus]|uniref:Frizzled-8-like protein n=1 Tax=Lates japonicus TaxID=270547 RepID=A0AAD3NFX6_LATJO|nr:frizzled-8-like protein [Lates japonicus]
MVEIKCSPDLRFFLCSMYTPICLEDYRSPCRRAGRCERAKAGSLVRQYGFPWPDRNECDLLQARQQDAWTTTTGELRLPLPWWRPLANPLSRSTPGKRAMVAASRETQTSSFPWQAGMFLPRAHGAGDQRQPPAAQSPVATFLIDMERFKYPERPIIPLHCYMFVSVGYICSGEQAIASYAQYFHLAAWLIPNMKSIAVLAPERLCGRDSVAGICYVGNQNLDNLRGFVLAPLVIYLFISAMFLLAGFSFRCSDQGVIDKGDQDGKLERLMIRIGVFTVLYTVRPLS